MDLVPELADRSSFLSVEVESLNAQERKLITNFFRAIDNKTCSMDDTICTVCIDPFTKQPHRKQAKCPYCDVKACTSCTQKYLMSITEDPHCMGCRKAWDREVLDSIVLTTWLNGEYKTHRENILLDRERSRLPAAQLIIERQKRVEEEHMPIRENLLRQITEKEHEINVLRQSLWLQMRICEALNRGEDPYAPGGFMNRDGTATGTPAAQAKEDRRVFTMPCPGATCRGFLSQAYKCGICDIYVCPECREIKGTDRDAPHTCNPDTVATVQRMKKECRPCPECGANIFRIEGCSMMWCTACNTPFDWNTGKKVVSGAIHNPHYFEFIRKTNGGFQPRTAGDIPCGAFLPNAYTFDREVVRVFIRPENKEPANRLYVALNTITHLQHVEIPAFTNRAEDMDQTDINIQYLRNYITEQRWKQLLQQREKKRLKKDEIRQRIEAFVGTCVDIYGRLMQAAQNRDRKKGELSPILQESYTQLKTLIGIFNESMMEISKRYKCTVINISDETMRLGRKKYVSGRKKSTRSKTEEKTTEDKDCSDTSEEENDGETNVIVPL